MKSSAALEAKRCPNTGKRSIPVISGPVHTGPRWILGFPRLVAAGVDQHSLYQELGQDAFDGHDRAALGNIGGGEGAAQLSAQAYGAGIQPLL